MASLIYNLVSTTLHQEYLTPDGIHGDAADRVSLANELWEFSRRAIAKVDGQ